MLDRFPARLALVHMIPRVAAERGIDHLPVLAAVGIDGGDATWTVQVVARARIAALLVLLAREAGDDVLGLDLASAADPAALGPAGLALGIGRTLGEALAAHIRHMPSLQGGLDYQLVREGKSVCLIHRYQGGTAEESRVLSEGVAAFMLKAVRAMAGDAGLPVLVELPHRPRVSASRYEDRLQTPVTFRPGDSINLSFDARHMTRANRANRDLALVSGRTLKADDAALDDGALVAAVHRTFAPAALSGNLALVYVAGVLGLAPRSLQRRLATLALSFEELVDGWRRLQAEEMLTTTAMPVGDVGRILGYSDPAHFTRAFHRWLGTTPSAWRQQRIAK
jgi:AraC-like DNA-binding protein